MASWLERLLGSPASPEDWSQGSSRSLYGLPIALLVSGLAFAVLALLAVPAAAGMALGAGLLAVAGALVTWPALRHGPPRRAGWWFVLTAVVALSAAIASSGGLGSGATSGYLVLVVVAGMLNGWLGAGIGCLLCATSAAGLFVAQRGGLLDAPSSGVTGADLVALIGAMVATAGVVIIDRRKARSRAQEAQRSADRVGAEAASLRTLTAGLRRRVLLQDAAAAVSSRVASMADPIALAESAAGLVRQEFGLSGSELYLSESLWEGDEGSSTGQRTASAARPAWEELAMLCVVSGVPRLAGQAELSKLRAEGIQAALAVPLSADGAVLGALVAYSDEATFFGEEHIAALQVAADAIGTALSNAREYRRARESAALSERVMRRYVQESWDRLVEAEPQVTAYRYLSDRVAPVPAPTWLPGMRDAVRQRQMVVRDEGTGGVALALPLVQNEVVIGAIGLRRPAGGRWDEDEQLLVRTVVEQMTQALENRRLFEAARTRAQREALIRRTTERIRTQPDLDAALLAAAEEMRRIVGASQVSIRLGRAEDLGEGGADAVSEA
ncbi:MAG: GAF domain-containing protein [Anaerolineae bacterium]|nr:GAF domain-containing protein [Anaerolineae bacterium]